MPDNYNLEKELDDVSAGSGARWSAEEENYLFEVAPRNYTNGYEGYNWSAIAEDVNRRYNNGRTAAKCQAIFYGKSKRKDVDTRIDFRKY